MCWKSAICLIVAAVVCRQIWIIYHGLQPFKVVYNHTPGPCRTVNPVVSGSEDMHKLGNNKVLVTSGMKQGDSEKFIDRFSTPGQIYIFDFNRPEADARVVPCDNFPHYSTKKFTPHGIYIYQHNAQTLVYVVNHPTGESYDTVEKFSFDPKLETLHHLKTYTSNQFRDINDILVVGPETFYVTNMSHFGKGLLRTLELGSMFLAWGNVVYYDRGTATVVVDSLMIPNGIQNSLNNKYVYVYEGGQHLLHVYERGDNGQLTLVQAKKHDTIVCDNIDVESSTGHVWMGCHSVAFLTLQYLEAPTDKRPLSPSMVLRIKTDSGLLTDDVTEIYHDDGSKFSGSTVAVYNKNTSSMIIGSIDTKMLYCKINYLT